ncbi:hypothetical protein L211DRAFT_840701 [Terfezia boudieri ATCC MYA-4762]|uniref:Uncharacterized protein n=1 Tax=Terfezia boudieri ATCC MYA-4762 TaxID=1051890 RepID=A0A3N4LF51_9PEZI|nr:hypothetical protein L211DRAFT_840701 [Terfezia boudieri ATCC MYA-4762]
MYAKLLCLSTSRLTFQLQACIIPPISALLQEKVTSICPGVLFEFGKCYFLAPRRDNTALVPPQGPSRCARHGESDHHLHFSEQAMSRQ